MKNESGLQKGSALWGLSQSPCIQQRSSAKHQTGDTVAVTVDNEGRPVVNLPTGEGVAEGIGVGMSGYPFTEASDPAGTIRSAFITLPGQGQLIGFSFSKGLATGITAGKSQAINAAIKAAKEAVAAAKKELDERSPSKVAATIGRYFTEGMAGGIENERAVAALRNASRYAARAAAGVASSMVYHNNQRTVNHNNATSNATVNVEKLYVRDQNDVRSISLELAQLNKMELAARGVR